MAKCQELDGVRPPVRLVPFRTLQNGGCTDERSHASYKLGVLMNLRSFRNLVVVGAWISVPGCPAETSNQTGSADGSDGGIEGSTTAQAPTTSESNTSTTGMTSSTTSSVEDTGDATGGGSGSSGTSPDDTTTGEGDTEDSSTSASPVTATTGDSTGTDEDSTSTGLIECGGQEYDVANVPPNVLILLDRSGSMDELIDGVSRWDIAHDAIVSLTANYDSQINFGLALYPGTGETCTGGEACTAGDLFYIDPAASSASDIETFLDGADLCDGDQRLLYTPTEDALERLADYAPLEDAERENFVLIVTDGAARCGNTFRDPSPEVLALRSETPEIQSFIVGFGSGVDPEQLTNMAEAGGRPRAGEPNYYQADDALDLEQAFADIAGSVVSCDFSLSATPPDPELLYVYIDGERVASNPDNGWIYDEDTNQLQFVGEACTALQEQAAELRVIFGCPLPS